MKLPAAMSLGRQSRLLTVVFLIIELSIAGIMWWRVCDDESKVQQENAFNEILRQTQLLVFNMDKYEFAIGAWAQQGRTPELRQVVDAYKQKMNDALGSLQANTTKYSDIQNHLSLVAREQDKVFSLVNRIMNKMENMENQKAFWLAAAFKKKTDLARMAWQGDAIDLFLRESKIADTFPEVKEARVLKSLVLLFAFINIILFLSLYRGFFVNHSLARLLILLDNTKRAARQEELHPELTGMEDEIIYLDRSMHEMQRAILGAQKERQAFLAVVSHELRTPLASIMGPLELLTLGVHGEISETDNKKVEASQAELTRLLSLINDLLDLEKLEAGQMKISMRPVYVESLIGRAIIQQTDFARQKSVRIVLDETDSEVDADFERMTQAVSNLLNNAIKHSKADSEVKVRVHDDGAFCLLSIEDSGEGIDESTVPILFDRFRRLPDEDGAIMKGMGLPIAKLIVQAHDGEIGYQKGENGGSRFWIRLRRVLDTA